MKFAIIGTNASTLIGFRKDLIKSLSSQGHDILAFAIDYTKEQENTVKNLGAIPIKYKLSRSGLNPISDIKTLLQLTKLLKENKPDIVFSYFSKPTILGTIAAYLAKTPRRIAMLEGLGFPFTQQPKKLKIKTRLIKIVQVLLYRISFSFLDNIIFLNHDDPKDLIEEYKLKVKKITILGGIGINLNEYPYSKAPTDIIRFIFVGRLLAEKGIHEYVEASKIVKEKYPNTEFIVLGNLDKDNPGSLTKEELDNLISDGIIIHPGHVSNVQPWIANSSVFVLPSYREGIPRSTQEAMAMGRPVITTDAPGCCETVKDGINGFLVPKFNAIALSDKMIHFIKNPDVINIMGVESNKIATRNYNVNIINENLIKVLTIK
ncbi:TPA: glycosyltransferase family 4 protein [Providencia alcalifaciens]